MFSPTHVVLLIILLLVALVVFGPKRLPEVGHSIGRTIQEFKRGASAESGETIVTAPEAEGDGMGPS